MTGEAARDPRLGRMTDRCAIEARRPFRVGGGTCTLLLIRGRPGTLELLPHACNQWAVELDRTTALLLRDALNELILGVEQ